MVRYDSDSSLKSPVLRRTKKINGVAKSPEKPANPAYRRLELALRSEGLFMLVTPTGGRLWRFRYRLGGVEKLLTLGAYPDVTLKRAREDARKLVADGVDPNAKRQAEKAVRADTFEAVAREWLELQRKSLAAESMAKVAIPTHGSSWKR